MKTLLFCLLFGFSATTAMSQLQSNTQENAPIFFAQCMVNLQTNQELTDLETQLKSVPYVQLVRVDLHTKRLFLLTKDLTVFSEIEFNSWMGEYAASTSCLQIGLQGVDKVNPYPFTDCQ